MKTQLLLILILCSSLFSQQWYKGEAAVVGSENESAAQLRQRALQQARVNILGQAGISIRSTELRVQGEAARQVVDMYSAFAQNDARGIIVEERNLKVASAFIDVNGAQLPQITVSLEGLIRIPEGEIDRTFEVELKTDKKVYVEGEDLAMTVRSSRAGYLSLFQIKNDSCFMLYPHPLLPKTKEHRIEADTDVSIPPESKPYSYALDLEGGDGERVMEFIIAIVMKDDVPIGGMNSAKEFFTLQEFNTWLAKTNLDRRCSASAQIQVVKK
jgi:hypothetical protein